MINTIGDYRYGLGMIGPEFGDPALSGGADLFGAPASAMHDQHYRRCKVCGDLGIEGQLCPGRDVGVVRPHNQDHFESIGELAKALHDDVQGLIRISARGLVGHPDGLVIGLRDAWLVDQKIDDEVDVVTAGARCRQRPEDADRAHFTG